jgi:hypothetical protein
MKRRAFLATTAVVATTGCLGRAGSDGDEPTTGDGTTTGDDDETTSDGPTDDGTTTTGDGTTTGDDDGTPTDDAESRCPQLHDSVDATVCAGEPNSLGVSFGQSTDRLARGELLELTLVNEDAASVGLNPYEWAVYEEAGDGWTQVDPGPTITPWVVLHGGERLRWLVGVGDVTPENGGERVYGGAVDLDPGEYAFGTTADVAGDRASLVAPFTVE